MTKIIVQDDILTTDEAYMAYEFFFVANKDNAYNNWIAKDKFPKWMEKLVTTAALHFDLSSCVGYEWWKHSDGSLPPRGWHYDLDEDLWVRYKELRFPLCSIIYYPLIQDIQGGHFITQDVKISPKTNRAIFMNSGEWHTVAPYQNDRYALLINPWGYKLHWARAFYWRTVPLYRSNIVCFERGYLLTMQKRPMTINLPLPGFGLEC
jgi:hypothetical protein